jgi:hypothetical protein
MGAPFEIAFTCLSLVAEFYGLWYIDNKLVNGVYNGL